MKSYKVMETFYSIQGEGYHTGKSAFFIRLSGCDIGCSWCDVKESWDAENSSLKSVEELVSEAVSYKAQRVIITGGEPAMYNLTSLTHGLKAEGIQTHLETSGVYKITGIWDWVCISPKKFKAPMVSEMQKADELKIVVVNKSDYSWAQEHGKNVKPDCKLFLQPEWDKSSRVIESINEYVKDYPEWRISLQTHKYMNIR
jgi:organic radical activating enzyme